MAILSKIKSAASKVASTVKKVASAVGVARAVASSVKAASTTSKPKTSTPLSASAISSIVGSSKTSSDPVAKITGGTVSTKTGGATTAPRVAKSLDVQAIPGSMSRALASMEGRTQKDLAVAAASPATSPYFSQKSSVGGSTSVNSLSRTGAYTAPVASPYTSTKSTASLTGASSLSSPTAPLTGATGGSMQGKLPQMPSASNFTGLSNNYATLTGVTNIDGTQKDTTGVAQETPPDQQTKALLELTKQFQPQEPERVDREQIMKEAGLTQALKEQQKLANQISAITAQKEAQLLQLRGVASTEGVTEAVYGGQQAQIERETAIKLLPLTAQYEAASGNVQAAKELVANFIADENNYQNRLYQYQQSVYNKVWDYATDQQKTALEEKRRKEDRQYQMEKDFRSEQNKLAELDIENTGGKNLSRIFGAQNYDELDTVYSVVGTSGNGKIEAPTVKTINGVDMQWNPTTGSWENIDVKTSGSQTKASVDQIKFLRDTIKEAKELAPASGKGIWDRISGWATGSSKYNQLEAKTNTLRTNVLTLMTDPSVKKYFGPQMSEADVRLMTAAGTTLNPEFNTPEQLVAESNRLDELLNRMETALKTGVSGGNFITAPDGTIIELTD